MIQNKCKLIGITGGIATGKSTVSRMLIEQGYAVIDADSISRQVVERGMPAYNDIINTFGLRILLDDKSINRKKLGRLIFSNINLRKALNKIVHPRVLEELKIRIDDLCKKESLVFIDMPLLFEIIDQIKEYGISFNQIWMIYSDEETQLKRLMERDLISENEAIDKIRSQISVEDKKKRADKVLFNNGNLDGLRQNLDTLLKTLKK